MTHAHLQGLQVRRQVKLNRRRARRSDPSISGPSSADLQAANLPLCSPQAPPTQSDLASRSQCHSAMGLQIAGVARDSLSDVPRWPALVQAPCLYGSTRSPRGSARDESHPMKRPSSRLSTVKRAAVSNTGPCTARKASVRASYMADTQACLMIEFVPTSRLPS